MAGIIPIVQKEDPVLRREAAPVPAALIPSEKIRGVIADMKSALASQPDGVAIAAPQIGAPLRIFIVSGKILGRLRSKKRATESAPERDAVFINPTIKKISKKNLFMEEGCLSVRYLYGRVKRATRATVAAKDEQGKPFERGGSGILAQIFQHELDHLDGVLFTDKAIDVHELSPEEWGEAQKKEEEGQNG